MKQGYFFLTLLLIQFSFAQTDERIYSIIKEVSASRIESDIRTLANFGSSRNLRRHQRTAKIVWMSITKKTM